MIQILKTSVEGGLKRRVWGDEGLNWGVMLAVGTGRIEQFQETEFVGSLHIEGRERQNGSGASVRNCGCLILVFP
jgi:hypothetical protein